MIFVQFVSLDDDETLPPPSPMNPKSSNVMVFRRSNKTVYTAGKEYDYHSCLVKILQCVMSGIVNPLGVRAIMI